MANAINQPLRQSICLIPINWVRKWPVYFNRFWHIQYYVFLIAKGIPDTNGRRQGFHKMFIYKYL